ncbi:LysR substrate-binding domain-containing protein [Noviherbaspirillum galbum]|uniref:LysR family transcriptional regulator n=1 Tax=Noviherbaspirillum galbum TaxID=2709383 RepID=A0A6B3SGK5_9BURK|nr:LysR substrate-binding domain-containing protein [Noviherbaspirillum galbum]NEX59994.1 LysR family transcriptional regulator [Noviherbaspirillum galbum]
MEQDDLRQDIFKSRIRLRHLDCFICVARTGHVGKAADALRMSQPAVSKTLSELEEITGSALLVRNRQGTRLTREGEDFLRHALAVMEALGAAQASFGGKGQHAAETLVVGALPTVAPDLLPAAIKTFREAYPETGFVVRTGANAELLAQLKNGNFDLVLGRLSDPEMMVGLTFELLYVEPMVFAARAGHPLCRSAPALQAVVAFPLIVWPANTIPRHHVESYLRGRGLKLPPDCLETLDVALARQMVLQTDAVWFTPLGAVRNDMLNGAIQALDLPSAGEEPVGLLRRSDWKPSGAASRFTADLNRAAEGIRLAK